MRALPVCSAAAAAACLLLAAGVAWGQPARARQFSVDCTATRSHVAASNSSRVSLTLLGVGTANVFIGGSTADPAATASATAFTLHVGASLAFTGREAEAGYECLTAAGSSRVNVLENY